MDIPCIIEGENNRIVKPKTKKVEDLTKYDSLLTFDHKQGRLLPQSYSSITIRMKTTSLPLRYLTFALTTALKLESTSIIVSLT